MQTNCFFQLVFPSAPSTPRWQANKSPYRPSRRQRPESWTAYVADIRVDRARANASTSQFVELTADAIEYIHKNEPGTLQFEIYKAETENGTKCFLIER